MTIFSDPNPSNLLDLFVYANTITGNLFWLIMMAVVWIVAYMNLRQYRTSAAMAAASFITLIPSVLLFTLNQSLIHEVFIFALIIGTAISAAWNIFK